MKKNIKTGNSLRKVRIDHLIRIALAAVLLITSIVGSAVQVKAAPEDSIEAALSGEGTVTAFIGEPFWTGKIKSEEDASEAIYGVMEYIGGDKTTKLGDCDVTETSDGITFYSFQQVIGDLVVLGASVKLIADKKGNAVGLVSSIIPDLKAPSSYDWKIKESEAEEVVKKELKDPKVKIIPKSTEKTLLPIEDGGENYIYVWVVYTENIYNNADCAYLAHYVDGQGNYLYSMPVSGIGSLEALSGSTATFAFMGMKSDVWSGTVKTMDGKKHEIEIPIMVDPETGDKYLGDVERKILCAEQYDFTNKDTLTALTPNKKGRWNDEDILTYYNFIQVYDIYLSSGWEGPDGKGTPSLLLLHAVDENGDPIDNAFYEGLLEGFQTFEFDTSKPYGESMDIVGHEFTHCFTYTTMGSNLYMNDYGAINEGMSDILGNLCAIIADAEDDEPYVIGERLEDEFIRVMGDPNKGRQPGFVWDQYYVPGVYESTDDNDNGGVHTNSSLLNLVSYRLYEAGIDPEDEFYFWENVSSAMTPRTDYEQMAYLMPWVMRTFGNEKYAKVIEDTVSETKMGTYDLPKKPDKGLGIVAIDLSEDDIIDKFGVIAYFSRVGSGYDYMTWPDGVSNVLAAALPPGKYVLTIVLDHPEEDDGLLMLYSDDGWVDSDFQSYEKAVQKGTKGMTVEVKEGTSLNLDPDSLFDELYYILEDN